MTGAFSPVVNNPLACGSTRDPRMRGFPREMIEGKRTMIPSLFRRGKQPLSSQTTKVSNTQVIETFESILNALMKAHQEKTGVSPAETIAAVMTKLGLTITNLCEPENIPNFKASTLNESYLLIFERAGNKVAMDLKILDQYSKEYYRMKT